MERKHRLVAVASLVVTMLVASYFYLTSEEGAPSYSAGDRWTWQVTRQELDPLTENVLSERTYEQTIECVGEETRGGYKCVVFKLTSAGQPGYGMIFRVIKGNELCELLSESFDENDRKISEYVYSAPILIRKFPLEAGRRFADAKSVSGHDNLAGIESIDAFESRVTEVVGKETLMIPAKIDTYRLRSWSTSQGTMRMAGATSLIIVTYEENLWYSTEVKEVVKSASETTTVVMTQLATSVTRTHEERVLSSYT